MPAILFLLLCLLSHSVNAQDFSVYEKKEYTYENGKTLPYRILFPENYDPQKKYPLILMLHGAGERGNNNESQLVHGGALFLKQENRKKYPAIVVFPQCPAESFWAVVKVDTTKRPFMIGFDYQASPNWPLAAANALVKKIMTEEAVDDKRVYISGLSMGGMGTFESVYRYPDLYAAALPICGGGDTQSYANWQGKTPFWIFHGDNDMVVNVQLSRDMAEALKKTKATVKYTEYPGVNHNSWDNAFAETNFLGWMMKRKRS